MDLVLPISKAAAFKHRLLSPDLGACVDDA